MEACDLVISDAFQHPCLLGLRINVVELGRFDQGVGNGGGFANPRTSWKERFVTHIDTFPSSPRYSLSSAGFPENWKDHDIWK